MPTGPGLIGLCLLFAGVIYQWPLFSENQNVYFLPGLAHAGFGALVGDVRAMQFDITPVFSVFVSAIYRHGQSWMYYAGQLMLVALYAYSLMAVVFHVHPETRQRTPRLILLGAFAAIHSAWMLNAIKLSSTALGPAIVAIQELADAAITGVAGQEIPGPVFQPSAFGVLLLASLALFLYRRPYAATLCAVAAATVHTSLIIQAAFLVGAYLIVLWREGQRTTAYRVAALAVLTILPIAVYISYWMLFVDPPEVQALAQKINVIDRQPLHTQVAVWFTRWTFVQTVILAAGLWVARRHSRLFVVMSFCACLAAGLALRQVVAGNYILAVLFPWRASIWLIPVATMIGLGWVVMWMPRRVWPRMAAVAAVVLVFTCAVGVWKTLSMAQARAHRDRGTMIEFVGRQATPGQTFLVPTHFAHFRLATGAPIFVDFKGSPYRSAELVEWDVRVRLAREFFASVTTEQTLHALQAITTHAAITHVIAERAHDPLRDLSIARVVYSDDDYVVYELVP
jgi:hypothetical protein